MRRGPDVPYDSAIETIAALRYGCFVVVMLWLVVLIALCAAGR